MQFRGGLYDGTLTIKDDGSWEHLVSGLGVGRFVGIVRVSEGKFVWKSDTTGKTGAMTLHEGAGKRVLVFIDDDRDGRAEYQPKR